MALRVANKHINLLHPYRKQGVVEIIRSIAVTCSAIVLASCGNGFSATVTETQPGNSRRSFADWCREKDFLTPEAKHKVEVLLQYAKTTNCSAADRELSSLTHLYLLYYPSDNNPISDIKPLASLTNLRLLWLNNNRISDIKPLASLTNLARLGLSGNPIAPKICPLKPESICSW